jgi:hypothetical protein
MEKEFLIILDIDSKILIGLLGPVLLGGLFKVYGLLAQTVKISMTSTVTLQITKSLLPVMTLGLLNYSDIHAQEKTQVTILILAIVTR